MITIPAEDGKPALRLIAGVLEAQLAAHRTGADVQDQLHLLHDYMLSHRASGVLLSADPQSPVLDHEQLHDVLAHARQIGLQAWPIAILEPHADRLAWREQTQLLAMEAGLDCAFFSERTAALMWLRHGEH